MGPRNLYKADLKTTLRLTTLRLTTLRLTTLRLTTSRLTTSRLTTLRLTTSHRPAGGWRSLPPARRRTLGSRRHFESAWVFWRLFWLVFSCRDGLRFVTVVGLFDLGGGEVIELAVDALVVEP